MSNQSSNKPPDVILKQLEHMSDRITGVTNQLSTLTSMAQSTKTWASMVEASSSTNTASSGTTQFRLNPVTPKCINFGKITVQNVPPNLELFEIKEVLQKQLHPEGVKDFKVLRVFQHQDKPECTVHFYPREATKNVKSIFDSQCHPMTIKLPPKKLLINNIPIQENSERSQKTTAS